MKPYLAYDNARCNGDGGEDADGKREVQTICTTCLRYLTRNDIGPRTPFVQGSVVDGKCELFVK